MYRGLLSLLGPKVVRNLALSLVTGLIFWAVELGFAVVIQAFFVSLGLAQQSSVSVPHFLTNLSLLNAVLMITGLGLARSLLSWGQSYLQNAAMIQLLYRLRAAIAEWVFRSDSVSTSRVVTLYNERAGGAGSAVLYLQTAIFLLATGGFSLISLFYLMPSATGVSIAVLAVLFFPMKALNRKIEAIGWDFGTYWDQVNGRLLLSIRNLLLIRIHGMGPNEAERAHSDLGQYRKLALGYHRLTGISSVLPSFIGLFLIVWIVLNFRDSSNITPGILVSYFYLFFRFLQNVSQLSVSISNLQFMGPQLADLLEWWRTDYSPSNLNEPLKRIRVVDPKALSLPVSLRAQAVGFDYGGSGSGVLQNFNLQLAAGKCCVITGPSGVGKSTALNLLIGELSPKSGRIEFSIDGVDWKTSFENRDELRPRIGYVGPDSFVVPGTLRQNLTYGINHEVSDAEIYEALRQAACDFMLSGENPLNRVLSEQGQGLSAGQKQRIALARALLRKPGLLVLDEATANIDLVTETQIVELLRELKGKITLLIVTHRETLLSLADQRIEF